MYDSAVKTLHGNEGFYPTNMFIARREILNDYATWLFSILLPLYDSIKEEVAARNTEQNWLLPIWPSASLPYICVTNSRSTDCA